MIMKKIKKILTSITAAAVSAISLCSMFSANAAITQLKTFRVFHEVKASSNITYFDYTIDYTSKVTANPSRKTKLLDNGNFVSTNNNKVQATYLGNAISSGIIATTDFYTPMSVSSIFNEINYNATIRNSSNNNIAPTSITITAVLMGDVNQDGVVDNNDVTALSKYFLNKNMYPISEKGLLAANVTFNFDQNGDPLIDKIDLSTLIEYVHGSIEHF